MHLTTIPRQPQLICQYPLHYWLGQGQVPALTQIPPCPEGGMERMGTEHVSCPDPTTTLLLPPPLCVHGVMVYGDHLTCAFPHQALCFLQGVFSCGGPRWVALPMPRLASRVASSEALWGAGGCGLPSAEPWIQGGRAPDRGWLL